MLSQYSWTWSSDHNNNLDWRQHVTEKEQQKSTKRMQPFKRMKMFSH